jgi:exodeoxyribonuclease-5
VRGVAVAVDGTGRPNLVVDGKSDVDPGPEAIERYREQVRAYLRLTGVAPGRLVLFTGGQMDEVDRDEAPR